MMTRALSVPADRSRDEPDSHATPYLYWWAGHYDHVFIALHPYVANPIDWEAGTADVARAVRAARPVSWAEVARATGGTDFPAFALAALLAGYAMTSASRPDGLTPLPDDTLIARINAYVAAMGLEHPWDDSDSPVIEPALGTLYAALGATTLSAWDELKETEVTLPVSALSGDRADWPDTALASPYCYADPARQMRVSADFDDIWSVIALTDAAWRKAPPHEVLEGFYASPATTPDWVNRPGSYAVGGWPGAGAGC